MNERPVKRIVIATLVVAGMGAAVGALNTVDARLLGGLIGALAGASVGFVVSAFPRQVLLVVAASIGPVIAISACAWVVDAIAGILEGFGAEPWVATLIAIFTIGSLSAAVIGRRLSHDRQSSQTVDAS